MSWWCCKADFGSHEPSCPNYRSDQTSTTLDSTCTKHGKPIVGDYVKLPKCKVEYEVCEDCIEELRANRQLLPHAKAMIQTRLV